MWRKTAILTQRLYTSSFVTFGVNSKYHVFNGRRLLRMRKYPFQAWKTRIVIIFSIVNDSRCSEGESFLPDVFPSFLEAFTSLVKCNLSAEVFRSLALFVTYALHKPVISASRTPMSRHGTVSNRSTPTQFGQKRFQQSLTSDRT